MSQEILGYTRDGLPIYPTRPGTVSTAAVISCAVCHHTIRSNGGPRHGALCPTCWSAIPRPRLLLNKQYSAESLCDVQRDVSEAFDPAFTPQAQGIPQDEQGFETGTYTVIVKWEPDRS